MKGTSQGCSATLALELDGGKPSSVRGIKMICGMREEKVRMGSEDASRPAVVVTRSFRMVLLQFVSAEFSFCVSVRSRYSQARK